MFCQAHPFFIRGHVLGPISANCEWFERDVLRIMVPKRIEAI